MEETKDKTTERGERRGRRYFEDREGDKSKRVTSTVFLASSIVTGALVTIFGIFFEIKSPELIKLVFSGFLGGCLVALGYTIPELFKK
jgi:hypothetical protein